MNIIYTGAFRFPAQDAASARVLNNAKILKKLGHKVTIISWGGKPRQEDLIGNQYIYEDFVYINTLEINDEKRPILERLLSILKPNTLTFGLIKKLTPEMVIAYNPTFDFTRRCLRHCEKTGIKFVSDITEWYSPKDVPGGLWSPVFWMKEANMRFLQKKVKNKIVISTFLDCYYKRSHNVILPPLIDLEEEKWNNKLSIKSPFASTNESVKIIFAGSPAHKDLLSNILTAVVSFKGRVQIMVVGVSKEQASKYIDIKCWQQSPESIKFIGKVPQDLVPSFYRFADFSIIIREPNRKCMAGFPTKFAESYAAGCPVIFNKCSDLQQYVENGINAVVVDDFSTESIERALRIVTNYTIEEISNMKIQAKKLGHEFFDYQSHIHSFDDFLQRYSF